MAFISGEQGNKDQSLRGTWEQLQYWGIREHKKLIGGTGEQVNLFQRNKGTGRASVEEYEFSSEMHIMTHL